MITFFFYLEKKYVQKKLRRADMDVSRKHFDRYREGTPSQKRDTLSPC